MQYESFLKPLIRGRFSFFLFFGTQKNERVQNVALKLFEKKLALLFGKNFICISHFPLLRW